MLRFIIISIIATSVASAQGLKDFKSGAAAVTFAIEHGGKSLTRSQQDNFLIYSTFIRGFLLGIDSSSLVSDKPFPKPEKWMMNPGKSAPSFSAFIAKYEPNKFDDAEVNSERLRFILLAWYIESHSKMKNPNDAKLVSLLLNMGFGDNKSTKKENKSQ